MQSVKETLYTDYTPCFIKKEREPNSAYFDNHKFKLYENRSKHAWIIVHCDYEI